MKSLVRGLVVVVAISGAASLAAPAAYGVDDADGLLPAEVSVRKPARVVSTALDGAGRPVVDIRTATDRSAARRYVREGHNRARSIAVELDKTVRTAEVPGGTDPYRADQWDFAKLKLTTAWQRSTGAGVTVAVIDTGVDAAHPDLAGNVLPGIDYVAGTTGVSTDPNGHGTHVAGTIAALTGNGVGVSAVAPSARILPIRVLGADGTGSMADAASGIVYAADHGAQVINMSLGSTDQLAAVTQAIAYARGKGVTVVAAAGNDAQKGSPVSYPGADPGVIAAAATDSADTVATFSNRGSYVDVAAPGVGILSTVPTAKGGYGSMSGTSMASPHVAAVVALLKAYRRAWRPDQIEQALESSAVDLGTPGKDTSYGWGRVDPVAALAKAAPGTAIAVSSGGRDVAYGTRLTTRYTVVSEGRPLAGRAAQVCVASGNKAFGCTSMTTTANGTVTVAATATANRRVRLTVAGVTTPVTSYVVRPRLTVAKAGARKMRIAMTGVGGQRLSVQRWTGKGWRAVRTYPAASSRLVTGLVAGATYRVVAPASAMLSSKTSGAVKV
ncbi:S8 family peptidase [Paractinoplanes atraurantiacus]|uniref:Type VII secretion-associated serine protease mycosin n=1 Tax=Paractinoplanes atraurantiacus TaxID=1036182 RepID=A0A285JR75_9ACTN|nr:S8 family peptidase [Actinoplanes atraurantiacus]SNY62822.1 type VII secretion-associated serine protease mycosin [Actinoplanes atraurantiacus]